MATRGVTFDQVAAVAERLAGDGKEPTLRNVRAALGTGSMNTLRAHLERWKEARSSTPRHVHLELSRTVLDALNQDIAARVADATSAIDLRMRELQEELEAISAESEQRAARVDELEADLQQCQQSRDGLSGRLQEVESEIERARVAATAAQGEAERSRRDAAIAAVSAERLTGVEAALEACRQELREAEHRAAAAARVAADQLLDAETRAARAEGELKGLLASKQSGT